MYRESAPAASAFVAPTMKAFISLIPSKIASLRSRSVLMSPQAFCWHALPPSSYSYTSINDVSGMIVGYVSRRLTCFLVHSLNDFSAIVRGRQMATPCDPSCSNVDNLIRRQIPLL
jgi:hypothetical protein